MRKFFRDFHLIDAGSSFLGGLLVEDGSIAGIAAAASPEFDRLAGRAEQVFSGGGRLSLLPGFIDMHAHLREPGFSAKETIESASLAAARGGWTSVVSMANTNPVVDSLTLAAAIRARALETGLIDLFPVLSLTLGMRGEEARSERWETPAAQSAMPPPFPRAAASRLAPYRAPLLSDDGKDVPSDAVFLDALRAAAAAGIPVSCHCDKDGEEAAVERALRLGKEAGAHIHIAHVSTAGACESVRAAKKEASAGGWRVSAEAAPHHIALEEKDARALGAEGLGKVAPPLRDSAGRRAVIEALRRGVIDAIATDHAPHSAGDKARGAPGFAGFETAFPVLNTELVINEGFSYSALSRLLSAAPAALLGFRDRGLLRAGLRADLVIVDTEKNVTIPDFYATRGENTPFSGRTYQGVVCMTLLKGVIVYERPEY